MTDTITRYAAWLPYLAPGDHEYLRTQHREVAERYPDEDALSNAFDNYGSWHEMYLRWTLAAVDSEDPALALRQAVAAERGAPEDIGRALLALGRISDEWDACYRPPSQIVGSPYLNTKKGARR
jgi:hypothetical protein